MAQVRKAGKSIVVSSPKEEDTDESVILSKLHCPIIHPVSPVEGLTFGLELLQETTHLFIRPSLMTEDHVSGQESSEHYDIIDCSNGRIYYAWETNTDGFGKNRTYTLKIVDFGGRPVLQVTKHSSCISCFLRWFNCCGSAGCFVTINTPDGMKLGELKQKYNGWKPKFLVQNEFEKQIMTITGPAGGDCCYNCNMMMDVEFPIFNNDGERIGRINKGAASPMENMETFGVRFPHYLTVEQKATLLGCVFALNFMFFDRSKAEDIVEKYEEKERERRHRDRKESYKRDLEVLGLKPKSGGDNKSAISVAREASVIEETTIQINYERRVSIIKE